VLLGAREDAVPPDLPPIEEIRAALPQFEILECIGRGGMGVVYKARQPQLDRLVALKLLLPGLEHDPGFAERFSREARALAKLSHPNIVAVHDFGESGGYFWLTMEYVDGVNLRQAMRAARFTPAQALAMIPELCAALQFAHDHGVLHRDIKPENILLDARGRVKVADFGIARMAGDERMDLTLTKTGSVLGSAAYIAPEQIERPHEVDHRADLYSLGVVFYEMLTGELPLGRFPAPSERSASDPRLDEVVFRSLEKEPEKRFQQAGEFSDRVTGSSPAAAAAETAPARRSKTSILALVAAALTSSSLVLGIPILQLYQAARASGGPAGFGQPELILILVGVILPALAGVILGMVALARIREAQGRLAGAAAAWFAVGAVPLVILGFPFLKFILLALLVGGIAAGIAVVRKRGAGEPPHPPADARRLPWIAGLAVGILLFAVAWHRFSKPTGTQGTAAVPLPAAASATPQAAVEALLSAARDRDERSFLAGMSRSFAAEVKKESDGSVFFGDFTRVTFARARQLDETTANVVVRMIDDPAREAGFEMILEDGRWKLNKISR
jgi:tRNA A-37 threonylcarbamoyl transferase component Bud32